jgi:SAM-dependent methyltransferase
MLWVEAPERSPISTTRSTMKDAREHATAPPRIFTPEYYARMRDLESVSWWNAGMRDIAARLLDKAQLPARGAVLDAGCGSGQTMLWFLSAHPDWIATGIDISPEPLAAARAARVSVQRASALELPFAQGAFDLVIALDLLQHLPLDGGDAKALSEFRRVLRPRGVLLIRTNAQSFPRTRDDPEFSYRKYERDRLGRRLVAAGFEIVILGKVNSLLGLAEIPRELRAKRSGSPSYTGLLSVPEEKPGIAHLLKKGWLELEGRATAAGWQLPFGRTIFALCRAN